MKYNENDPMMGDHLSMDYDVINADESGRRYSYHRRNTIRFHEQVGAPHSVISVRNLYFSGKVGKDAWGRKDIAQPVLLSAKVSLENPFSSAAKEDDVDQSTVHYGVLSKELLNSSARYERLQVGFEKQGSIMDFVAFLISDLTGSRMFGSSRSVTFSNWAHSQEMREQYLLGERDYGLSRVYRMLEVSALLPKATLLGEGVSVTMKLANLGPIRTHPNPILAIVLRLHNLQVATIVGINPNERLSKQNVVANIELDGYGPCMVESGERADPFYDDYEKLEQLVTKTIEESAFGTLEKLALHIKSRILRYFMRPEKRHVFETCINIKLEKPTAVTFAEAPAIEISINMLIDEEWQKLCDDACYEQTPFPPRIPLHLNGKTLLDWIRENDPNCEELRTNGRKIKEENDGRGNAADFNQGNGKRMKIKEEIKKERDD